MATCTHSREPQRATDALVPNLRNPTSFPGRSSPHHQPKKVQTLTHIGRWEYQTCSHSVVPQPTINENHLCGPDVRPLQFPLRPLCQQFWFNCICHWIIVYLNFCSCSLFSRNMRIDWVFYNKWSTSFCGCKNVCIVEFSLGLCIIVVTSLSLNATDGEWELILGNSEYTFVLFWGIDAPNFEPTRSQIFFMLASKVWRNKVSIFIATYISQIWHRMIADCFIPAPSQGTARALKLPECPRLWASLLFSCSR